MEEQLVNREIKFNVPKKLTKAEFENTIKFFKENGAKYHVDEKIWTIKESQREKFAQYLNPENMHAAHKNEPQSPEERVRLNIPKNLDKDEFLRMIQYFKENGAKYQPDEKVWTIGKSQKDSFEKYIMTDTNESNSTLGNVEEIKLSEEEINMLGPESAENMKQFFLDHGGVLKDSMWIVPKSAFELEKAVPESNIQETMNKKEEFTNKLDQLLREYGYDKGYAYSMDLAEMISKETLHMPPEPEVEVAEAESSTSLNSTATVQTTDREGNYRKGNYVSLHVPDYKTELIDKIQKGMDLQILNDGGDRAYYSPKTDSVHLPEKDTFYNSYAYNATALHELSHATGAEKRLNRDIRNVFGTEKYAYEELVAEISACFMSEHIQIEQTEEHVNNHKAYIQSWTKALSEKPEMLMKAIRDAEKAANYLEYHAEILSKEEYQETLTLHENEETPTPGNTSEKMVEKTANPITREADLKANGYKLTPALKKHMDRLDQLTGRKNSVKDIYKAYKTHDFHGDPETEKTIKSIGKIFQRQEMQIKAVIPER
jgi:hypothetical protein